MHPVRSEIIDPSALTPAKRERLVADLYEVQCLVFAGVSRDDFARYILAPTAQRTRIQVFSDLDGRKVGYMAFHLYEREIDGQRYMIGRSEAGLLPEYRQRTLFARLLSQETLRAWLCYPRHRFYGLLCATHPATYRLLSRLTDDIWPHWDRATPPQVAQFMEQLAVRFRLQGSADARPGVYQVGWKTRESQRDRQFWSTDSDPATQYYLRRNPNYGEGAGLLILCPMTPGHWFRGLGRLIVWQGRRMVKRLEARIIPKPALDCGRFVAALKRTKR